jgi:nicotinamidase-related amidase
MKMSKNVQLFIIDPQHDFCNPNGTLYVPGAEQDMQRLSTMVTKNIGQIDDIHLTLDSHNRLHIAHPIWWVDGQGNHPDPFTIIAAEDVRKGKWRAYNPGFQKRSQAYVESLETNGRYALIIWPYHCLIGTLGQTVDPTLNTALSTWEEQFALVNKVPKGSNMFTEHYSAVRADVEDPEDETTGLNAKLIKALQEGSNEILIAGEALSHCVANTIRDVANEFDPSEVKKFVLLEDACSNVTGFEQMGVDFVDEMVGLGMRVSTTDKFFS